jgi:O-succinylbenzoate synthase
MRRTRAPEQVEALLYHLEIPLLAPFTTATGRVSKRTVGLVRVGRSGSVGWGEASPYPGQDEPFSDVLDAARTGGMSPTLSAAIDEATADLAAREQGVNLASVLGPPRTSVTMSIAVGMGDSALSTVEAAARSGVHRFKVKVMPGRTGHVGEIRRRFPRAFLGVDANGSFDQSTVGELLDLSDAGIAYVEQPTPDPGDPAVSILSKAGFAVFSDESVRSVSTAQRALACAGIAGVVVKPGRLGWGPAVEVVESARAAGKHWRASGLLETGIGRAFTLSLAAAQDAYASDLAPASRFFSYDIAPQGVLEGNLVVPTGPGTGVEVDSGVVKAHAVEIIPLSESAIPGRG